MKTLFVLLTVSFLTIGFAQQPAYKNPSLPIEIRVTDLLQCMTLEEQAAQIHAHISTDTLAFDKDGNFIGVQDTAILNHGVGSFATWTLRREHSLRHRNSTPCTLFKRNLIQHHRYKKCSRIFSENYVYTWV